MQSILEFWLQTANDSFHFCAQRVTVGRDQRCAFVLPDRSVMPLHATFVVEGGRIYLEKADLDALTFLNRAPVHIRAQLYDGDVIDIGPWSLLFRCPSLDARTQPLSVDETYTPSDVAIVRTIRLDESMQMVTGDPDDTTSSQII